MNLTSANLGFDLTRTCDDCDAPHTVTRSYETEQLVYGSGEDAVTLEVVVPVWRCAACDSAYTDAEADEIRHEAICHYLDRPTPREIREFREANGLSQDELAKLGRFGIASIKRWELGEQIPSASAAQHLQLLMLPGALASLRTRRALVGRRSNQPRFRTNLSDRSRRDAQTFMLRPMPITASADLRVM
jgi:DNA-binding transcriptional regulator YiaG